MSIRIHIIEQLKWSLLMLKIIHKSTPLNKLMIMIPNLKLVIMSEYQNTKILLQKITHQIGLKKFLQSVKLKYSSMDICY